MDTYNIARQGNRIIVSGNPARSCEPGITPSIAMFGYLLRDGEQISPAEWIRRILALSSRGTYVARHLERIRYYMSNDDMAAIA